MLKVFNTISKKKEDFVPLHGKNVNMYVCGPTVYGPGHIGHARTYVAFDIIRRYLEYSGYAVKFVVNITDVHDDIIRRANEQHTTIFALADKNIESFFKDMDSLGVKKASENPRVTQYIPEIIKWIDGLQKKGMVYETEDGVYFDVAKFKNYGKLSGIRVDKSVSGTRVETDKYEKENAHDFAVWKKAKEGEPSWKSPWGNGRPGWHIECTVMSTKNLGETIDIHGGAVDLIFPHHENEIAQTEGLTGKTFVKYWLHTGFLNVEGQKMSKSLGNFIIIPDLLAKYDAKTFRFFISTLHYRSLVNFSEKEMEKAKNTLQKLNDFIQRLMEINEEKPESKKFSELLSKTHKNFTEEMDDDFNLPNAWAKLFEFVGETNKMLSENVIGKKDAEKAVFFLKELDTIFGIFNFEHKKESIDSEIEELIKKRDQFRAEKKWKESDEIRNKLKEKGIELLDTPQGTKWKKI